MGGFSFWHILIFAIIVLLLFGGSRFSNMMGDIAKGLKSFKQGMAEDEPVQRPAEPRQLPPQTTAPPPPVDTTASRPQDRTDGPQG